MVHSMLHFIEHAPTGYHAVAESIKALEKEDYVNLSSTDTPAVGGKYYTQLGGAVLIAFRIPENATGFVAAAAHTDSPCLRLRETPELAGSYVRLSAERYGGLIHASWIDRPLSIAGRVLVRSDRGVEVKLVDFRKDTVLIPNLAIHLNREMNNGTKYDPYLDLVPLYGLADSKGSFSKELSRLAGCREENILSFDLFVYNNQKGTVWGAENVFVSAPRLDDLACVYSALQAFLQTKEQDKIPVFAIFDHEEIGSATRHGAGASFFPDTLAKICASLGLDLTEALRQSLMLSCDNGHGVHPNHPELADRTQAPLLGGGIIVKHSPRYATDGISAAVFQTICQKAGIRLQHYANRADQAGGATLGNIANTKAGMMSVDIGMAQLAMHSAFETAAAADVLSLIQAISAAYAASFTVGTEHVEVM